MIWAWGVIIAGRVEPTMYFYDSDPTRALEYAKLTARKERKACHVVKLVQTHFVKAPECVCEPEVKETNATPEQPS